MRKYILFTLIALTCTGCALPEVTLKDALLTKLNQKGLEIGLNLDIYNPNEYALPLAAVDWDLDLFQSDFTAGQTAFSRNIPAQRRADVQVPIGIQFQTVAAGAQKLLTTRRIPWGIEGGCAFRLPATDPIRVGFAHQGHWTNPLLR